MNLDTFMSHVTVTDGCWMWNGPVRTGYGRYAGYGAHRQSYMAHVGPIPEGMELDHLCNQPLCVRPDHLEPVTRAENMRRRGDRITACINGHDFTETNTYRRPNGQRACRPCNAAAVARSKARRGERSFA